MICQKCTLSKTCRTSKIPGRGSSKPVVMFVGQAPGREEDQKGSCFVGPAGQLLVQAINSYSLKPAYITNLVKCFPPDDRDPKSPEIEACKVYLEHEIKKYNPRVIVTLGNIPTRELLHDKKAKITDVSGRAFEVEGRTVIPLLHPSFILRYPHNQHRFENGLREIQRKLRGENSSSVPQTRECSPEEASKLLQEADGPVAFDYETTGIEKSTLGQVRCVGFATDKLSFFVSSGPGTTRFITDFLRSKQEKIAHNSIFERRCSAENYGVWPVALKWDTLAMHYLIDENAQHGLEVLAGHYLGASPWDISPEFEKNKWTYATVPQEILGKYCAIDCFYTRKLYTKLVGLMDDETQKVYHKVLLPLIKVCAKMENTGLKFDRKYALGLDVKYEKEMALLRAKFLSDEKVVKACRRVSLEPHSVNLNSAVQLRKILVNGLQIKIDEETEAGQVSVKESALEKVKNKFPLLDSYLEWKRKQTLRNNFIQKFPKFAGPSGLIKASFNPCLVVSGRLSVTSPPLQAVPANPEIRGMFCTRFKEGSIVSFDFKQLEMRLVASESGEIKLIKAFVAGEDPHNLTAGLIFGEDFTKEQRSLAKRINFGIVYGVTSYTLAKEFNMTEDNAQSLIDRFYRSYPAIFNWMKKQKEFLARNGFTVSRFGRKRRLGNVSNMPDWQRASLERQAGNFPIQSMGADMTNLCLKYISKFLSEHKFRSKLVLQVHDSVVLDCPKEEVEAVKLKVTEIMTSTVPRKLTWLKVPIEVDCSVGERWS